MRSLVLAAAIAAGTVISADAAVMQVDANPFTDIAGSQVEPGLALDMLGGETIWPKASEIGATDPANTFAQGSGENRGWDWECDRTRGQGCDWEWDGDWDLGDLPPWWWWWWDRPELPGHPGYPPEITPPPAAVPLPPALLMLVAAVAGLGVVARRKKS